MSFTDTEKHWLWGCAAATAASRSDVNVAMPHLRGKWSPTKAILRTLEFSFMRSFKARRPCSPCHRDAFDGAGPEKMKGVSKVLQFPVIRPFTHVTESVILG